MAERLVIPLGEGLSAHVCFTAAADGDFRVIDPAPGLDGRRKQVVDLPWTWIRQVHGRTVLQVCRPGQHAGAEADALHTSVPGCAIAVTTADCAPVVLVARSGVAVIHAGWRGLADGIIERAGAQLVDQAGPPVAALLGPCIEPAMYEFGRTELDLVADRLGPTVESKTGDGNLALDVPAAVAAACQRSGWPAPERRACTSDDRWFSHRTRADHGRQTAVAWLAGGVDDDGG